MLLSSLCFNSIFFQACSWQKFLYRVEYPCLSPDYTNYAVGSILLALLASPRGGCLAGCWLAGWVTFRQSSCLLHGLLSALSICFPGTLAATNRHYPRAFYFSTKCFTIFSKTRKRRKLFLACYKYRYCISLNSRRLKGKVKSNFQKLLKLFFQEGLILRPPLYRFHG